jgi:ABC-type transport system involved in Fe-S cluster assembly fused permease/ATPase subunit
VVDAHEILVTKDGCIVERGTHAQLLELNKNTQKCGICRKIVNK